MGAAVADAVSELLACPACGADLDGDGAGLSCRGGEEHRYAVTDGAPVLLTERDELGARYLESYEAVAREDLATPPGSPGRAGSRSLELDRRDRHDALVAFIGHRRARRLLDIGTGMGEYLDRLDAEHRVALDLALPYLGAGGERPGLTRVCADAQQLPFKPDSFDVVVLSDVLEHVLDPHAVAAEVLRVCTPDARIFVHVPWKEDLSIYAEVAPEFAHLRSFNSYSFANVWQEFYVRRWRGSHPDLRDPLPFPIADRLPLRLRGLVGYLYFSTSLPQREYRWRSRWIAELPRRERLLLRIYPPKFMMAELTPLENAPPDRIRRRLKHWFEQRIGRRPSDEGAGSG